MALQKRVPEHTWQASCDREEGTGAVGVAWHGTEE